MKIIYIACISFLLASCGVQYTAKKQARILVEAIKTANYEVTVKYTHSSVIQMVGGKESFIEILKSGTQEMKAMGNSYESIKLGKPSRTVNAGNELHCLIPEKIKMNLKDGKILSKSYLLAASKDQGKNWTFIETAILTSDNITSILPNYNKELVIPEKEVPQHLK